MYSPIRRDGRFKTISTVTVPDDAAYLDLAIKESLALASLDKELVRAAEQAGLALFKI
jgi:predicted nucleic acid-binding protein